MKGPRLVRSRRRRSLRGGSSLALEGAAALGFVAAAGLFSGGEPTGERRALVDQSSTAQRGAVSSDAGDCNIRGNISASGERIYHVPGQEYYGRTRIDSGKGERYFCTEAEARAAGWRRSKVWAREGTMATTSELIRKLERDLAALQRIPANRREAELADVREEACSVMLRDLKAGRSLVHPHQN